MNILKFKIYEYVNRLLSGYLNKNLFTFLFCTTDSVRVEEKTKPVVVPSFVSSL